MFECLATCWPYITEGRARGGNVRSSCEWAGVQGRSVFFPWSQQVDASSRDGFTHHSPNDISVCLVKTCQCSKKNKQCASPDIATEARTRRV